MKKLKNNNNNQYFNYVCVFYFFIMWLYILYNKASDMA